MLSGHASLDDSAAPASYAVPVAVQPVLRANSDASALQAGVARGAQTSPYRLGAGKAGSQPSQYQGTWHCVSQVTASNIAGIQAGRAMECYLHFQLTPSGQLLVGWDQQGWSPANCSVVNFNPTESSIVHKSMSLNNVDWSALSQDRLRMLSCNIMQGHSRIVQYRAGQPVGVYETVSSLTRVQ